MLMAATILLPTGVSQADPEEPPPPPLRHVQYTVFTEQPYTGAEIYYRDTDPPNWAEYSHNPYLYSPNIEAALGPDQQWNLDVWLANPDAWAMVTAGIADRLDGDAQLPLRARGRRRGRQDRAGPQGGALLDPRLVRRFRRRPVVTRRRRLRLVHPRAAAATPRRTPAFRSVRSTCPAPSP